jgi:uncharacterized protein (DUF433 family)
MRNDKMNLEQRIVIDSKIRFGKPYVVGTRIPVYRVLEWMQAGMSFEKITTDYYPDLAPKDVAACAAYATESVESKEMRRFET